MYCVNFRALFNSIRKYICDTMSLNKVHPLTRPQITEIPDVVKTFPEVETAKIVYKMKRE